MPSGVRSADCTGMVRFLIAFTYIVMSEVIPKQLETMEYDDMAVVKMAYVEVGLRG
jgi:hypothetical protein